MIAAVIPIAAAVIPPVIALKRLILAPLIAPCANRYPNPLIGTVARSEESRRTRPQS